jgi:hypothetical protein
MKLSVLRTDNGMAGGETLRLPSLFDVCVAGLLAITYIKQPFHQGVFFVFYTIFLYCITLGMTPCRDYKSTPLALLLVWSLAMVFCHNSIEFIKHNPKSIINYYFNVSMMFEGFIFILCGSLLLFSIMRFAKDLRFVFLLLPIAVAPLVNEYTYGGRMTIPLGIATSVIIYLFLTNRQKIASVISLVGVMALLPMWKWVAMKFACRPVVWQELLWQIKEHPLVGTGFNRTLNPDNMVYVRPDDYGWLYRHNDILSLTAYLGIIAGILLLWFIAQSFKQIGTSIYLIPFLAIILISLFQMTFFTPDKGALCLLIGSISIMETYKKEAGA